MTSPIYLDHSNATPPSKETIQAMAPFLSTLWGAPLVPHQKGQELLPFIEKAFRTIYDLLGMNPEDHFVLTSSGTESVNQVIHTVYNEVTLLTGKNQFLISSLSEAPALMTVSHLETLGCAGRLLEPDHHGIITPEKVASMITPRTALVSVGWGCGLTGLIQPVADIASLCRQRGVRFHVEGSHVIGKIPLQLKKEAFDYFTFHGGTVHAPAGSGGIYCNAAHRLSPLLYGSADQGGKRGGALNLPFLIAMTHALQEAISNLDLLCSETSRLRYKLESQLRKRWNATVLFADQERLPHCTTLIFPKICSELLLYHLNHRNVYATMGGVTLQQLGHLLGACHIDAQHAQSALSFSLSRDTIEEEIDRVIEIFEQILPPLFLLSPSLEQTS
jgi:cysteine desulfurase